MRKTKANLPTKRQIFWEKLGAKSYKKGKTSENLAVWFLRLKGYRIVARRYRTYCGEIDIIARKHHLVALVEIKARPNLSQAMEAVSHQQQARIEAAGDLWLARQPDYNKLSIRYDLIAICPNKLPKHIKAFWTTNQLY